MNDLGRHFPIQMNLLKEVDNKFKKSQKEIRELNEIVLQLKNTNIILQQSEAKLSEKINNYNAQIYNDTKVVNEYYRIKNEHEILKTENESLKNFIYNLEQKIKQIEIDNKRNIENIKNNFKTKEKALEEQIETLQAAYTLDNLEKENDIKQLKYEYERKLENVIKREQNLKIELFDLKRQMTSTVSLLNKKISELQEKNKLFENNHTAHLTEKTTNFTSAKNILNDVNANNSDFQNNTTNNKIILTNHVNNNMQIQNTVNINKIEMNPVKKFQFRKPHSSAKKLLSEDFDPFKMHKETSSLYNFQEDSSSQIDNHNSCSIIDNSLVGAAKRNHEDKLKFDDYDEDEKSYVIQSSSTKNHCTPRKRKLFNPNNFDYLE